MLDAKTTDRVARLTRLAHKSRVFLSMPWLEGLTPSVMNHPGRFEVASVDEPLERRHGIFTLDEASLSPLDHGGLYGDACFEGILIENGQIFQFREHMERWWRSAESLRIRIPYSIGELAWWILKTVQSTPYDAGERGYLRPVATRGFGDLGINPDKCLAPTFYCIASTIQLYPEEKYQEGINLSVARATRRAGKTMIDPNIKSNNYLNNIFGLLESRDKGTFETMMLTENGFVAEATADNIFLVTKEDGFEQHPSKVHIFTPTREYCLEGITRNIIIRDARNMGYTVHETSDLMPIDFVGTGKECFMTGTGCGLMPVVGLNGISVGEGKPGPVTRNLLKAIRDDMANPAMGLSAKATRADLDAYMR